MIWNVGKCRTNKTPNGYVDYFWDMLGDIIVITIISIQTRISTLCNRGMRTRDGDDDHAEDAVGSIRQLLEELEGY